MLRKLRSDNTVPTRATVVKQSLRHGRGLFAARDFVTGELVEVIVGYIQGELEQPSKSKYAIKLRCGTQTLVLTNKTKYINHSTDPNVRFSVKLDGVYALRDIQTGEELLSRYHGVFRRGNIKRNRA